MSMRSFFFFVAALARSISGWASAIVAFTYVVFGGQKVPLERPRVRTREGEHPWQVSDFPTNRELTDLSAPTEMPRWLTQHKP